jgi:two-component system, sporulation sensor kinase C
MNQEVDIVQQNHNEERNIIAIHVEDLTNRRLLEGLAVQLNLEPRFVSDQDLGNAEFTRHVALIVADEPPASRYRALPAVPDHAGDGMHPALVAVLPATYSGNPLLPMRSEEQPFDGVLVLPQLPSVVLAQLSVILYAHRSTAKLYNNALDELQLNRRIFRSVTSGISIAAAAEPDLPLSYVNPAFEVITGYSLEEVAGKNCRFLQHENREQPGLVLIREAIANQRPTVAILKNYKKDGTPFWNELLMSPIFDRDGKLTHYVGIQNDVTARVAFEEALRESEKLAATGRLAASIAHEINNPLEAVTNLLYLAEREVEVSQKDEYVRQAVKELHRVSEITTQSLRFYRQSSKPRAVRAVDIVTTVLDVYSVKMTSWNIVIERQFRTHDSIVCLESEIRQVVSNLVRNAMDAMRGPGGKLIVRVRNATCWRNDSQGVSIAVADYGTGMSDETRKKLFQAFYTTKENHGIGLGLWLSQEIIARHHGRLVCRTSQAPGRSGTLFTVFLPFQAVSPDGVNVQ